MHTDLEIADILCMLLKYILGSKNACGQSVQSGIPYFARTGFPVYGVYWDFTTLVIILFLSRAVIFITGSVRVR